MTEQTASDRIHREWRNRVEAEYTSAAITAQAVHWMLQAGIPEPLVHTGLRIIRDEMDHARLSHEALVALGGDDTPSVLDPSRMGMAPATEGILASLVDTIVRNFCLGETFAVPLFNAMRLNASHEAVLPMITRVLQDEAVHRAFGWDMLDHLVSIAPDGVRQRVSVKTPEWLFNYEQAYATQGERTELTPEEASAGMISGAEYARIYHTTLERTVLPWFAQRGITVDRIGA